MSPTVIENDGQAIASTNFFDTELAERGLFYLSGNAGALRLLCPDNQHQALKEMEAAKEVIVTLGPWMHYPIAIEVMFEDYSDSPFCLHLSPDQMDRLVDVRKIAFPFTVWTRSGCVLTLTARSRHAKELPCLEAWE